MSSPPWISGVSTPSSTVRGPNEPLAAPMSTMFGRCTDPPILPLQRSGDETAACDILGELIAQKFKVIEFRQTKANLEDIFMNVTKGGVQ